ncbi:Hint domain-containing protein [Pseudotabrizicola sp. L79]|uniref:Hint domain-containing protein n=1 Tax=Pseudotabrizicola sp. L79 TaxID=3118402 RepID=UPI002F933413
MQDWIALSDLTLPPNRPLQPLRRAVFICEVSLPLASTAVVLDWQPTGDTAQTFSIFLDATAGIILLHRLGNRVRRHVLPGPLPMDYGTARITYGWNQLADRWVMTFSRIGSGTELRATGRDPIMLDHNDLADLCRPDGTGSRHPALLWFGVTQGSEPPQRAPWIGLRTPIETARGAVAAGNLRPGDMVRTVDNGLQPVLRMHHLRLPSRGSFAPVILRAPFLGQGSDVLLGADQLVVLNGPEVEYMFGEEEVLVQADALTDGSIARRDSFRAAMDCVSIDLGLPELLLADGLQILSHSLTGEAPRAILHPYEAQQLVSLIGRRSRHGAA